jgi:hypothetical protein
MREAVQTTYVNGINPFHYIPPVVVPQAIAARQITRKGNRRILSVDQVALIKAERKNKVPWRTLATRLNCSAVTIQDAYHGRRGYSAK